MPGPRNLGDNFDWLDGLNDCLPVEARLPILVRDETALPRSGCHMILQRLDNWCEKAILVLVLAVLVFGPLATGAVRPLEFLIVQGLTTGAVLLWVLRFW